MTTKDHDPKKVPEPSETCPRCHHFSQTEAKREGLRRSFVNPYPHGIDQNKAAQILAKAFPQKQRGYG